MSCEQGGERGQLCASLQINISILLLLLYLGCAAGSHWWGGWKLCSAEAPSEVVWAVFSTKKGFIYLFLCFLYGCETE